VLILGLMTLSSGAQEVNEELSPLRVGTKAVPPFVIHEQDGSWSGISIELWDQIAEELGLTYELQEMDLQGLTRGLQDGTIDLAVAALTITLEREERVDFTHPFFTSGLGIAVSSRQAPGLRDLLGGLIQSGLLKVIVALILVIMFAGFLVWFFERRHNPEQFGGGVARGVGSGFWWSAVTMTTVGYGDKAPKTLGGRMLAVIWMFAAILMISGFTAAIATSLTVLRLHSPLQGPEDLPRFRVGSIGDSTGEAHLRRRGISSASFALATEALDAVRDGQIDAVVYDAPILRYLSAREFVGEVQVLPHRLERQDYGFALPHGSSLREPINRALLAIISDPAWEVSLTRYLGE
jgi:ABC-type amino acid transport substrate-binding protein